MQLKKIAVIVGIVALAASSLAAEPIRIQGAQRKGAQGAALGLFLGQPTGITFRYGFGGDQSIEAKAAWNFAGKNDSSMSLQANWLLELPGILVINEEDFPLYVGAGVQTNIGSTTSLGFRIPAGVIYRFAKVPIELCLELGLGMQLIPSTDFIGSGGLGVRYRF